MRWWLILLLVGAAALVWWATSRQTLPRSGTHATGTGSAGILDSLNSGASKLKTLFSTVFGGSKDAAPSTADDVEEV